MEPIELVKKAKEKGKFKTYNELSEAIGVSEVTIRKWTSAERAPKGGNLIKLAELSGVAIPDILLAFAEHHEKTPDVEKAAWREIREGYERAKADQ